MKQPHRRLSFPFASLVTFTQPGEVSLQPGFPPVPCASDVPEQASQVVALSLGCSAVGPLRQSHAAPTQNASPVHVSPYVHMLPSLQVAPMAVVQRLFATEGMQREQGESRFTAPAALQGSW